MWAGGGSLYIRVCQCGGWGWGWVCVFVCSINYLNPTTIKAEICYRHHPLGACVGALMPRSLSPPSGLSMGPDKDHKLWILNTHPSRTKANSALLWPEHSWTRQMSSSRECMNMFTVLFFFYVKCSPCLQSHGVFNLHCEGLVWGDVCSMHALFFFPLQTWWLCMGYLLGSRALYSHLVFRLFPFLPCHYSPLLSILFLYPVYPHMFYSHSKLPISHHRKQHHSPVGVRAAMSGLFSQ